MDEIRNPTKVVPLVGDVGEMVPHPDQDTEVKGGMVRGIFMALMCYVFLAVVFAMCYGLAWVVQQGVHWFID